MPTRIEAAQIAPAPLITARALAPLPQLLALAAPLLAPGGICLFLKGANVRSRIDGRPRASGTCGWRRVPSQTAPEACIFRISDLSRVAPPSLTPAHASRPTSDARRARIWRSPTRRAASARPRPPSTWRPRSPPIDEKVLLIDLDPQGNASTGLGHRANRPRDRQPTGCSTEDSRRRGRRATFIPNLSLVTAEADLAGAEIELVGLERREFRLRDALAPLRTAASALQLRADRLPAQPGVADPERPGRRRRRAGAAAMRVLCFGRHQRPGPHHRDGQARPQSDPRVCKGSC